ncbi:MarR family transcriptional regulator [Micromonospora tulbaghiae]|uniref:DNA-binding transcriptional regulator, MarR family n=1 Tax=Micromonospora tulbaghiae TaxID=479978 RepID=A0AAW4JDS8_9ACTN|nr:MULTISPECIES: MarR family transcriptional regulator [Micromonospora]KAB1909396.1 MarR family transcriptional regulator [Micromonospora sp. AMSO1212t]MBO4139519.1 MarR family transcriptional regulator [Micromonospora tulbaghiae]MDX5457460.1 MarR family transcriptional regulator [Micromonospora tulbaghiae]SCE95227.1 DNA-binding transcriptional regulator, MarR family [Micromonospora tulbaghiae]
MTEERGPRGPETSTSAALDEAAGTLLAVWEAARERTTSRLSSAQLRAIMVVEQYDGINLRRLATLTDMLLSSASRLCDRLVAAGMLEREPGRYDRREISLHLTPAAIRLLAELRADRRHRLERILAGMSPEGRAALVRGMREFDEVGRRGEATVAEGWPMLQPSGERIGDPARPSGEPPVARTA